MPHNLFETLRETMFLGVIFVPYHVFDLYFSKFRYGGAVLK